MNQPDQLDEVLDRLEATLADIEAWDPERRQQVFALLDDLDSLHRVALRELSRSLGDRMQAARHDHPAIEWLLNAYEIGASAPAIAKAVLDELAPYVDSHGGSIQLMDVVDGTVHVRMAGACAGCTGSFATLRDGVEALLAERMPGFVGLAVEEEPGADQHPPPGPTLVALSPTVTAARDGHPATATRIP